MLTSPPRSPTRLPEPSVLGPDPEIPGTRFAALLGEPGAVAPVHPLPLKRSEPARPVAAAA